MTTGTGPVGWEIRRVGAADGACGVYSGRARAFCNRSISDRCWEIEDWICVLLCATCRTTAARALTALARSSPAHLARCPDTEALVTTCSSLPAI